MKSFALRAVAGVMLAAPLLLVAAASAAAAPVWEINSFSNTRAEAGGEAQYIVQIDNNGDEPTTGPFTVRASLPAGLTGISGYPNGVLGFTCSATAQEITCDNDGSLVVTPIGTAVGTTRELVFTAAVGSGLDGQLLLPAFEVSGGGAAAASTVDPMQVGPPAAFGVDAFDGLIADSVGAPFTRAGGHPAAIRTYLDFNTLTDAENPFVAAGHPGTSDLFVSESPRDVLTDLPLGLAGAAAGLARCNLGQLLSPKGAYAISLCDPDSQIGTVRLKLFQHFGGEGPYFKFASVYNMQPPPGTPASFAFTVAGTVIVLDARLRSDGTYGLAIDSRYISQAGAAFGLRLDIWGVPGDPSHDSLRHCPGEANDPSGGGKTCTASRSVPFIRLPTSCSAAGEGLRFSLAMDSWQHPGALDAGREPLPGDSAWKHASYETHEAPGYPRPPGEWGSPLGTTDCGAVPFEPRLSVRPTTSAADSPSGLEVDLEVPQDCWAEGDAESICPSDLRDVSLALPEGMSVNPSSAGGRQACSAEQVGYVAGSSSPFRFAPGPQHCPDASKIGEVTIESPLLGTYQSDETTPLLDSDGNVVPRPLHGAVYLAAQGDNPFQSLLAIYLVVEDAESGVTLKLPGRVVANQQTGQLETIFDENPQLPFSRFHVELYGGPRAALRTPPACGGYTANATLAPWSGNPPVSVGSSFQISQGCGGGFDPKLSAGTTNPLAGQTSPFSLRLTRDDGEGEFAGLAVTLPPGLTGYLKGIPYCPDSALAGVSGELGTGVGQEATPSCPAASRLGTVTVGAGAGVTPFYTQSGRAYLAGPYKGAPLSLAVVAPAVAGPFDLGSVVVRNALRVNPQTAQITTVSDPLPSILHGIPLDLRDVRVHLDRDHFTLNPTDCDELQFASTVTSTGGAAATPSQRFQVAGCDKLAFKPKLTLRLHGQTKRSGNPGLRAVLKMPQKTTNANLSRVQVSLPRSEFIAQDHLSDVCTRVQYAAAGGGGAGCPAKSVYGHAVAYSPLLDAPLEGNVYLRSNGGERALPDLVAALNGQIQIEAVGYVGSNKKTGGLRTTFATIPDAPVEKIVLTMPAGRHSLLENSTNICRGTHRAIASITAHNNRAFGSRPKLKVKGCGKSPHKGRRHHAGG